MNKKLMPFSPLDLLDGEDEMAEYLIAAFNDKDPKVFVVALQYVAQYRAAQQPERSEQKLKP